VRRRRFLINAVPSHPNRPRGSPISSTARTSMKSTTKPEFPTYIGDRVAASELVRERVEPWHEFPSEERELIPRETPFGKYLGSRWQAQMPDGRSLQMYRGLDARVYEKIRQRASEPQNAEKTGTAWGGEFHTESEGRENEAVVRSVASDGSILEIEIR
jgi:hypothetical protein